MSCAQVLLWLHVQVQLCIHQISMIHVIILMIYDDINGTLRTIYTESCSALMLCCSFLTTAAFCATIAPRIATPKRASARLILRTSPQISPAFLPELKVQISWRSSTVQRDT